MFLYFPKTGFDTFSKLSPLKTIYMKCQNLFSGKREQKLFKNFSMISIIQLNQMKLVPIVFIVVLAAYEIEAGWTNATHYENMPIQIYWKFYHQKMKILIFFFHISAQNIDCGYSLEPPRRGGSNGYPQSMFWAEIRKIMYIPVHPSFTV